MSAAPQEDVTVEVTLDGHLGAVVPAAGLRLVAAAAQLRMSPALDPAQAARLAADLGAVPDDPAYPRPPHGSVVLLVPAPTAGSPLLDAVAVMDRLRSPGGCPWDAAQTPESLLRYLVEETYELYDAVADGDRAAVREELGDVLLQVLFHARIAQEAPDGFGIDDVAADLVTKLVARHPHVFAAAETIDTAEAQQVRWEELKAVEKRRASALDGVARAQPAAALVAKYLSRARRAGVPDDLLGEVPGELYRAVATGGDPDPEGALRAAADELGRCVRLAEDDARADGADPAHLDASGWHRYWPGGGEPDIG